MNLRLNRGFELTDGSLSVLEGGPFSIRFLFPMIMFRTELDIALPTKKKYIINKVFMFFSFPGEEMQ